MQYVFVIYLKLNWRRNGGIKIQNVEQLLEKLTRPIFRIKVNCLWQIFQASFFFLFLDYLVSLNWLKINLLLLQSVKVYHSFMIHIYTLLPYIVGMFMAIVEFCHKSKDNDYHVPKVPKLQRKKIFASSCEHELDFHMTECNWHP